MIGKWSSLIAVMLFFGGLQMLFLGIIGQYTGRIYSASKQRPLYIVDEVLGKSKNPGNNTKKIKNNGNSV